MGIFKDTGSPFSTLSPTEHPNVIVSSPVPSVEDHLLNQEYTQDLRHNETALNTDRDAATIAAIRGYSEGSAIIVTWFHNMESSADRRTHISDVSMLTASQNKSYLRINNFELRLTSPFSYDYNAEDNYSTVTGEALVYPGFSPRVGDVFTYSIQPGTLSLFKVSSSPQRLTFKSQTSHQITFSLIGHLDRDKITALLGYVKDEAWFDKRRFLNEEGALLTKDDVYDMKYTENKISELSAYFVNTFYNHDWDTFVRPDGVYDPYIIEFCTVVLDLFSYNVFATQLLDSPVNYKKSVWYKLLHPERVSWKSLISTHRTSFYECPATAGRITALLNREYVIITDDDLSTSPYISENIGVLNVEGFTEFDHLLSIYLEHGGVDTTRLTALIDGIYDVEDTTLRFYQILVLIQMLYLVKSSVATGKHIQLGSTVTSPYVEISFIEADLDVDDVLLITSPGASVVGLLSDTGASIYPESTDISYIPEGFTIDLSGIKAEQSIVEFPDGWKVIISNPDIILR